MPPFRSLCRPAFVAVVIALFAVLAPPASAQTAPAHAPVVDAARRLLADEDYRAAADTLETLGADALDPAARFLLARAYAGALRHARVVDVLADADSSDVRAQLLLGRSLVDLGRTREAVPHFETAYRQDTTDAAVGAALARLYADFGRWADVRDLYARMVAADDVNPYLHAQLGSAYRMLDSTDAAIVHLEIARRLDPKSVGTVLSLTSVYYGDEKLLSARRVIDAALKEIPNEARIHDRCGDIALKEERYKTAVACFGGALAHGDTTALALRKLGVAYYLDGSIDSSLAVLDGSFARDTSDAMTAFYLGLAHMNGSEERYDEALRYLDLAVGLAGQGLIAEMHQHRAAAFDRSGRDGEAIRAYRLVHTLNPAKRDVLFHLAALYDVYYRDKTTAAEQYEAFLAAVADLPPDRFADLRKIAERRLSELREEEFFRGGIEEARDVAPADSAGE